jgi:hypothetical protein
MKYLLLPILLLTSGCLSQTVLMEAFQDSETEPVLMEINSVPPPFDLNGRAPYVLWVNGVKTDLPKEDLEYLVAKVGVENIKPIRIVDIHQGWLWPHFVRRREPETPQDGRIRIIE